MNRISSLFLLALCLFCGCKKAQEYKLIAGEWKLESGYMNHSSFNILNQVMPYYASDSASCYFQIIFENDGTVYGNYYTFDTLNYFVVGEWKLKKYNFFYIKIDQYLDGTFNAEELGDGYLKLTSDNDSNTVSYLGLGKVYAELNIHLEKK